MTTENQSVETSTDLEESNEKTPGHGGKRQGAAAARGKRESSGGGRTRGRGRLVVDDRTVARLRWLARVGWADVDQVAARFGSSPEGTQKRFRKLEAAGLIRSLPLATVGRAKGYLITTAGVKASGAQLPAPWRDISPATETHDWCVTTLCALLGARGIPNTTVREMIAGDREALPSGWDPRGKRRVHYPDVILNGNLTVAIEVERTLKSKERLRNILAMYRAASEIDRVVYFVDPAQQRRSVEAAARVGLAGRLMTLDLPGPTVDEWRLLDVEALFVPPVVREVQRVDAPAAQTERPRRAGRPMSPPLGAYRR